MKRISLVLLALVSSLAFADGHKGLDWDAALSGDHRSESNRARDQYRHPRETLEFFGLSSEMTVLEVSPGGGWYTEVLAPLLKDHGHLVAGHGAPNGSAYGRRSLGGYLQKLGRAHDVYSAVDVRVMQPPALPLDVEAGSVDMAVVFRNVHSWLRAGTAEASLADIHRALKSGGTLGIVQHRGTDGMTVEQMKRTAYVTESKVIEMAVAAGFVLDGKSEINANTKDTKDYPGGVWTLPPSFGAGDDNRAKYAAIGESDRMTLRFMKPWEKGLARSVEYQVDATGLKCPEPVMMLHAAIRKASSGDVVCLTATDPSTQRDVAKFCDFLGHELLEHCQDGTRFLYRVKKAG